ATARTKARPLLDPPIVKRAVLDSFRKLHPRVQVRNPVMSVVLVGAVLTLVLFAFDLLAAGEGSPGFVLAISLWLSFTLLFANFAEAMAEGRGKAQADALRHSRRTVFAKVLVDQGYRPGQPKPSGNLTDGQVAPHSSDTLTKGMLVLVEAGEFIPL